MADNWNNLCVNVMKEKCWGLQFQYHKDLKAYTIRHVCWNAVSDSTTSLYGTLNVDLTQ